MKPEELEYRNLLISTQRQLNENYDKLVVTLSGGALALSMTFLKDIINLKDAKYIWMLVFSWSLFILSLAAIFGEILFGIEAYKKAVTQLDNNTVRSEKVGGLFSSLTKWFSRIAAMSLVLGLLTISLFVFLNLGDNDGRNTTTTTAEAAQPAAKTTATE
ncbi:MAG: hypothetical protein JKY50_12680 [Oleispira sp.]|nr:hypothetical protein [Oleispira sp.]